MARKTIPIIAEISHRVEQLTMIQHRMHAVQKEQRLLSKTLLSCVAAHRRLLRQLGGAMNRHDKPFPT
jgi:hypothetical protein